MSLAVTPPSHFKHPHTNEGGIGADSVTRLDLARTSTLRYLEYSASRQSSLPINHDCQQTATNYLLYQLRGHTRSTRFFICVSQAPQTIYESPTARPVHGTSCVFKENLFGSVRNALKKNGVYSSDSQLLLSRPSVSGAYLRSTQETQLLGYQYVAAVFFISEPAVLFPVCSS